MSNRYEQESVLDTLVDTFLSDGNFDILIGFVVLIIGGLLALINKVLGAVIGIGIGGYFINSFLVRLSSGQGASEKAMRSYRAKSDEIQPTSQAPITDEPTIADQIKAIHMKNDFKCPFCGATVLPTDFKCKHCGSVLVATANLPRPAKWADAEIGNTIRVNHPKKGTLDLPVVNRIYFGELWQAEMKPNVPWTLTGDYYVGLGLANDLFLLNWQSRFYLLEVYRPLTDMSINRDFAPYARKFGASNQTRTIRFPYHDGTWEMFDIGRFRIEFAEGNGIRVSPGAIGRFIHARQGKQVLVVEDYQSGGSGLDNVRQGYEIKETDISL